MTIDNDWPWLISIGDDCTITDGVIILAHDASMNRHMKHVEIGKVIIGNKTFVGVNSVILPNVQIGNNVIIGAGSVVTHNIPNNSVAVGCPARVIKKTEQTIQAHNAKINTHPIYSKNRYTKEDKRSMWRELLKTSGYLNQRYRITNKSRKLHDNSHQE